MTWAIVYVATVLVANYTAVWFIPRPMFGSVAVGTLNIGATFTARDYVHRLGRRRVYAMIGVAAVGSVAMSLAGPVDWRIVVASVLAIVLSETADTEVYHQLRAVAWPLRVAGSNAVSIPLDSITFNLIAFAGVLSPALIVSIVFGEIVAKTLVGLTVALWRYLS